MSDLVGTDQDADADDTISSTRDEDEDGDRDEDEDGQDKGDGGESETSDEDNDTDFQPENEEYEDEDAIDADAEILNIDLLEDDDPRGKKRPGKKRKSGSVGANRRGGRGNKRPALSKNISSDGQRGKAKLSKLGQIVNNSKSKPGSSTNTCNKTLFGSPGPSGTSGTVGVGAGVQSNADATKTPSPTRGVRGSFVWNYFRKEDETGNDTINGICNTCRTPIKVKDGSTNAMRNHLKNKHKDLHTEMLQKEEKNNKEKNKLKPSAMKDKFRQSRLVEYKLETGSSGDRVWGADEKRTKHANNEILDYILNSNKPLSTVDDKWFWKLICHFQPYYKIPSRTVFLKMLPEKVKSMTETLKKYLQQATYVSFTTDIWTSKNMKASHISVSCHWITKEWQRRDFILACTPFPDEHNADNIAEKLNEAFSIWGLNPSSEAADANASTSTQAPPSILVNDDDDDHQSSSTPQPLSQSQPQSQPQSKPQSQPQSQPQQSQSQSQPQLDVPTKHTIVRDGAKNMRNGCNQIKDCQNVQCVIHLLQLVVKDALFEHHELKPIITKCRDICRFVHQSSRATNEFRRIQMEKQPGVTSKAQVKQLIGDVTTRWNSTYIMMRRILKLRDSLDAFMYGQADLGKWTHAKCFSPNDWAQIEHAVTLLKPFYTYTDIMSSNKICIGLTIPIIMFIKTEMDKIKTLLPSFTELKNCLQTHLDRRFFSENPAEKSQIVKYNILTDPRFTIPSLLHPAVKIKALKRAEHRKKARGSCFLLHYYDGMFYYLFTLH